MRNWDALERATVSRPGPGPMTTMFLSIASSALVRVMVCPLRAGSNWMVSLSLAAAIVSRSEPAPLSTVVVTISGGGLAVAVAVGVAVTVAVGEAVAVAVAVGDGVPPVQLLRNKIDTLFVI